MLGDFNFHLEILTDPDSANLLDLMICAELDQRVIGATHKAGHTLDHIFTNNIHLEFTDLLPVVWSDHKAVLFKLSPPEKSYTKPATKLTACRAWNKVKAEEAQELLTPSLPHLPINLDDATHTYNNWLEEIGDKLAPQKNIRYNMARPSSPWYTLELKEKKLACKNVERIWRREYNETNKIQYKLILAQYKQLLQSIKQKFFAKKINLAKMSTKELFKTVTTLTDPPPHPITESQELCDNIAEFFFNKVDAIFSSFTGPNITTVPIKESDTKQTPSYPSQFDKFASLTITDTSNLIMMAKSGSPIDPCPLTILKLAPEPIALTLVSIFNAMFKEWYFPKTWKRASIIPFLKKPKLDSKDPNNFRPISRLPLPAQIIEKTMNTQLSAFLEHNNILDSTQYGFRGGHSTESALLKFTEEIRITLDQGGRAAMIMLDLSAAFDTVHHSLLMDRLQEIRVKGSALMLLTYFLSERVQNVSLGEFTSKPFTLPCGVPQGSSISSTLFNIYVSQLASLIESHGFNLTSYADDTQIVVSLLPDCIQETASRFQDCMTSVGNWMAQNCLKINSSKTEVVLFGNNSSFWSPTWSPDTMGKLPTPIRKVKNLGVYIDNKLTFKDQENAVVSASSYTLRACKKIMPYLPKDSQQTVITALVMSKLDYCNSLYLNIQEGLMKKLQLLQNSAARLLTGIPKHASISAKI